MARLARDALMQYGAGASLRDISTTTQTSLSNLLHYFGDRDGLLDAVAEVMDADAAPWLKLAASLEGDDITEILDRYFMLLLLGWRRGLARVFEVGLGEGIGHERRGMSAVNHLIEPTLQSLEALLGSLVGRKMLPEQELRIAALTLLSPVLLVLLHQDALSGHRCRPLDVEAFVHSHVRSWLSGHASC
jgi:AcrR family transcriptional regulator